MGFRAVIYVLILGLGLFGATGLGVIGPAAKSSVFGGSVSIAAPLSASDNGGDNGGSDNGGSDNGGSDNGGSDNGGSDNGGSDNGGSDNGSCDDGSSDNGSGDNGSSDNGGGDSNCDNGSKDNGGSDNGGGGGDNDSVKVSSSSKSSSSGSSGSSAAKPPSSQAAAGPPAQGGPCWFVFGFKELHDLIPGIVGDCRTNEIHSENGDGLQYTAGGLMVWRKADNWTAFTNGAITWLNGPCGLQTRPNEGPFYGWEGKIGSNCVAQELEETGPLAEVPSVWAP